MTLKSDPEKHREWQRRSAERAQARRRERAAEAPARALTRSTKAPARAQAPRKRPARNDGPWRRECIAAYGEWCRKCGKREVQMDHMIPRSQGGKSVVENGLPLCPEHHQMKTDSQMVIEYRWLTSAQRAFLASERWVDWDDDGQPFGRGHKHFGPRRARADEPEGGQHDR